MNEYKTGLDLTKQPPRSPHVKIGGFCILGRTIDKCRASIWGKLGEYHFDCPLDNQLFGSMDIKGADFKAFVAEGHSDEEIAVWIEKEGMTKTPAEIAEWNDMVSTNNYATAPDKKAWLQGENARLGIGKDSTLFDYLDADDKASFKK
jgi:hypothetical protein